MTTKEFPPLRNLLIVIVVAQLIVAVVSKIADSLVSDVLGPLFSKTVGGIDIHQLMIVTSEHSEIDGEALAIRYGQFIVTVCAVTFSFAIALLILALLLRIAWRFVAKIIDSSVPQLPDPTSAE